MYKTISLVKTKSFMVLAFAVLFCLVVTLPTLAAAPPSKPTLPYATPLAVNGNAWSSCYSPDTQSEWAGCFNSGTSTYSFYTANITYNLPAPGVDAGPTKLKINYQQQKDKQLPSNYPAYKVRLLTLAGDGWRQAADLSLPAAGPNVPMSFEAVVNLPTGGTQLQLQWYNDVSEPPTWTKDANLQIDSFSLLNKPAAPETPTLSRQFPTPTCAIPPCAIQVAFKWAPNPDNQEVTNYQVYRNGVFVTTVPASTSPFYVEDVSPAPGRTYNYQVKAVNAQGISPYSGTYSVTTPGVLDTIPPSIPADIALFQSRDNPTSVNILSWSPSTDNHYILEYRVYADGVQVGTVSRFADTTFRIYRDLHPTGYYTVRAVDYSGNISASSAAKLFL